MRTRGEVEWEEMEVKSDHGRVICYVAWASAWWRRGGSAGSCQRFFPIFFFLHSQYHATLLELCGITSNARLNVRHGIGQLQLQMAMAGHFFWGARWAAVDLPRADAGEGH